MGGLFDFLNPSKKGSIFDAFGKSPAKEAPSSNLPALPAPKSQLPAKVEEQRGLVAQPPQTLKEKMLSLFDAFGPPKESKESKAMSIIPGETVLPQEMVPVEGGGPWDVLFDPSQEGSFIPLREEEREVFQQPEVVSPRYKFVRPEMVSIPYGSQEWSFPSIDEMARHLSDKIDLKTVFEELIDSRFTFGYQDLLADAAFKGMPLYTPISVIDDRNLYSDMADFYGIPWAVVERVQSKEEFISKLLIPLGVTLTEAFETMKPDQLPGFFTVDWSSKDGKYWLYYVEPWIGRLPRP